MFRTRLALAFLSIVIILLPTSGWCQQSQCLPGPDKVSVIRENVYFDIARARAMLAAYDMTLDRYSKSQKPETDYSMLNQYRGEILQMALSAYFFAGAQAYPADDGQLSAIVDAIPEEKLDHLEFPARLEVLAECGILSHLPASPYSGGAYVSELPAKAQPGDIYYLPIPIHKNNLLPEPGHNEGEILVIFDKAYDNNDSLLSAPDITGSFFGDLSKYMKADQYNNICFIYGQDPDTMQ